jgi:hypothetical protein
VLCLSKREKPDFESVFFRSIVDRNERKMSDDATIEDEPEIERPSYGNRPETNTGLLKWSYIFEIGLFALWICVNSFPNVNSFLATKQWFMFLAFSIAIGVFLYVSRQRKHKSVSAALSGEYVPGASKEKSRSTSSKRD